VQERAILDVACDAMTTAGEPCVPPQVYRRVERDEICALSNFLC
jgi:hypothetical protein